MSEGKPNGLTLKQSVLIEQLQRENRGLRRRLDREDARDSEYLQVLRDAVADCLASYKQPVIRQPPKDARSSTAEVAICVASDWQLGKRTPTYNAKVCAERVSRYVQKVRRLIQLHRAQCPVRVLKLFALGDLVEGEFIFPGQAHLIDKSLIKQVTIGAEIFSRMVLELAEEVDHVEIEMAIGNHGRLGRRGDYHPESNMDAMLYEFARRMVGNEERITWGPGVLDGERKWYFTTAVGKHRFMGFHGDQVRGGFAGFPWYGFAKKLLGWSQMMLDGERFDYAISAHYHTPVRMYVNGITLWGNGSTESSNTYAAENLAAAGRPSQWLLFCHPEKGVTAEYEVHLEKD